MLFRSPKYQIILVTKTKPHSVPCSIIQCHWKVQVTSGEASSCCFSSEDWVTTKQCQWTLFLAIAPNFPSVSYCFCFLTYCYSPPRFCLPLLCYVSGFTQYACFCMAKESFLSVSDPLPLPQFCLHCHWFLYMHQQFLNIDNTGPKDVENVS